MRRLGLLIWFIGAQAVAAEIPDPTQPFVDGAAATSGPVLESTVVSHQRKLAVISGRTLSIGAHVGRAVIVDITPYEVLLRRGDHLIHLRLLPSVKQLPTEANG